MEVSELYSSLSRLVPLPAMFPNVLCSWVIDWPWLTNRSPCWVTLLSKVLIAAALAVSAADTRRATMLHHSARPMPSAD
ncbi:hypothetical protein D3C75_901560 [compost metagenome]